MRVFSQINNCQQKQKQTNIKKQTKQKWGLRPLLGLAKSIDYYYSPRTEVIIPIQRGCSPLQVPSDWQVRVADPTNRNPELHA